MQDRIPLPRFFSVIALILVASTGVLICGCSNGASDGCVDVTLGSVPLSVPQQHMTPRTPRKANSGNFIFAFDTSMPGIDCPVGCQELFVNVSYHIASTPERQWLSKEPKYTGRMSGNYRIYLSRYDQGSAKPLEELLVPSNISRPQDEFYGCDPEGRYINPLCTITVVAESGLVAQFSIPRKVIGRGKDAARLVEQAINQFSENHIKGICK